MMHEKSSGTIWIKLQTDREIMDKILDSATTLGGIIWSVSIRWAIESKGLITNFE